MYITENDRLDLIVHPVVETLIEVKWKDFAEYCNEFSFFIKTSRESLLCKSCFIFIFLKNKVLY
jgi:hypothetical protein